MINILYYIPHLIDHECLIDGLTLYSLDRSYINKNKFNKLNKLNKTTLSDFEIFNNIINDDKILIKKFDNNNYLTYNKWKYENPLLCSHYIFWTLNNNTHNDVLKKLIKLNIITQNTEYMIWMNSKNQRSIKSINHYQIIVRPKIFNIKERKLRKIIIVARHGPREPIDQLNKLDTFRYMISNKNDPNSIVNAKLTKKGIKYCFNFGKYIKQIYGAYFDFNIKKTLNISTDVNRTIESVKNFMYGLFDKNIHNKIELSDDLIGYITMNKKDRKEYEKYHKNMILINRSDSFDSKIFNILGYTISDVRDYFRIYSTLEVYKFHNQSITDNWTKELDKQLKKCAREYYYKLFYKTKFCNVFTDILLKKINKIINNKKINFAYLSTHDITIYPLAIRIAKEEVDIPYFCSSVRFEIWDSEIRIYYDGTLISNKIL